MELIKINIYERLRDFNVPATIIDEIFSNEDDLNKALDGFYKEYSRLNTKKIGRAVLNEAEALVKRLGRTLGLRALDAIHLATFNLFDELEDKLFVAADNILLNAAQTIGAKRINPISGPKVILPKTTNLSD